MDLRSRAIHSHEQHQLERDHERQKAAGAEAEQLADEARRYTVGTLELEQEPEGVRAIVTPGTTTATVLVDNLPAFQYRRHFNLRPLFTCPECGDRQPTRQQVRSVAELGAILTQDPARLELVDHDRPDDPTWRCNGQRSWSTVQQPPTFRVELIDEDADGPLGVSAALAASLGRMAAATANPAQIIAGPHSWLIVARIDPDPPQYDSEEPF